MQNKAQLEQELSRNEKEIAAVIDAMLDPNRSPAELEQMQDSVNRYSENIDLLMHLLEE